jgi:hypothetical protein
VERYILADKVSGKDIAEREYEKARFLIDNHKPLTLPDGAAEKI